VDLPTFSLDAMLFSRIDRFDPHKCYRRRAREALALVLSNEGKAVEAEDRHRPLAFASSFS
jgi:hypothetical protein